MNNFGKILVGNLASEIDLASISSFFGQAEGTVVSVEIPVDTRSGKSKGFALVEMSSQLEAEHAISKLQGLEVCGRRVTMSLEVAPKRKRKWYRFGQ